MSELLAKARTLICVGSGGVGKTTLAAAIAFKAAQAGRRVLVLTIDPAKRLKTTLDLPDNGDIKKINHSAFQNGSLSAAIINSKRVLDDIVVRLSNKEAAQKILANKLYIQLSTTLSGSQEFSAIEKLQLCLESGEYDLVVLDTPPTKHAIDFLNAPQKLTAILNENVSKWFRNPKEGGSFFTAIIQKGTKQVIKALELLTGSDFIKELASFFTNIQTWQSELEKRVLDVHKALIRTDCHFVLVSSFDEAKLKEAQYFSREIKKGGYHLSAVVINRSKPKWLEINDDKGNHPQLSEVYKSWQKFYEDKEVLLNGFTSQMRSQCPVYRVPDLEHDISDLDGVAELSELLPSF
jgi:anion-transporting  ArsA/GET3 family ATPase